jgi:hypothetical protein
MTTGIENFYGAISDIAGNGFCRRAAKSALTLLALGILPACSIHPVQSEVTGFRSHQIVDRIRCETRLAIQDKAIRLLLAYRDGQYEPSVKLGNWLATQRGDVWNFDPRLLTTDREREFYYRYIRTGIAYEFSFDIFENTGPAWLLIRCA